jgi:hypothetical protein
MRNVLQNRLHFHLLKKYRRQFFSFFLHLRLVTRQTVKHTVTDHAQVVLNQRSQWFQNLIQTCHRVHTHFYIRLDNLFADDIDEVVGRSVLHELVFVLQCQLLYFVE